MANFEKDDFGADPEQQKIQKLCGYKYQIKDLCHLIDVGMDLRRVETTDIDEWDRELRAIAGEMQQERNNPSIFSILDSSDAVRKGISKALNCFYVASDILKKDHPSTQDRQDFYEKLREGSCCLSVTLQYFSSDE